MHGLTRKGKKLILGFPYSRELVNESKQLGPSKYDPDTKTRSYGLRTAPQLIQFCSQHDLPISDDARKALDEIESLPEIELYHGGPRVYLAPGQSIPDSIQTERAGDWVYVSMMHLPELLKWGKEQGKRIDPELEHLATGQFMAEARNYNMGTSVEAEPLAVRGLKSTPLPEQWVPSHVIKRNRKAILADEQGLGKTLESLIIARLEGDESERMVVVCPDRLTQNWVAETETHFEEGVFTPFIATGRTPKPIPEDADAVMIGWSILGTWAEHLVKWKPDFVVSDEGHYAKAGKAVFRKDENGEKKKVGGSSRSSAIFTLLNGLQDDDKAVVLAGTPMPNRPHELLPILQALGIEGFFGGTQYYRMHYCDGQQKFIGAGRGPGGRGYVWDYSGGSNLVELNSRLLSSGHYVRRTKKHLVESGRMPTKNVDGVDFFDLTTPRAPRIIDGDPEIMKEYMAAEYDLSAELADHARYLAGKFGCSVTSQKVLRKLASEGRKNNESIFKLRRIAGLAAVPSVIKIVQEEYLDKNEKIVIVAHHREVTDAYADAFEGAVKIQGAMTTKQIENAKAQFNAEGFDHPVLVLAMEAGKTGHTLCKQLDQTCANMLIAESAWNPSDDWQVQDRIWRIGQNRPVYILNTLVGGTVQERIYAKRQEKERNIYAAIDGIEYEDSSSDDKNVAGELALDLARRGLNEKNAVA